MIFIQKHKFDILILKSVIIFNAFLDTIAGLFLRLEFTSNLRAILLILVVLYFFLNRVRYDKFVGYVVFLLLFYLMLIIQSSNFTMSIQRYLKFAISLSFIPIGYSVVKYKSDLIILNKALIIAAILITFNVLFSTITGVESKGYVDESGYSTGTMFSGGLFTGVYFVVLSPLILSFVKPKNKQRRIIVFLIISILIINVLTLKRSTLLAIGVGFIVYGFMNKQLFNRYLVFAALGILLTSILFSDMLDARLERRQEKLQVESFTAEARYLETITVVNDIFSFNDLKYSFFGKELFNTAGNYGDGIFGRREIHNDYIVILNGSGIVGLILYLTLFLLIYKKVRKLYKMLPTIIRKNYKDLYIFTVVIIVMSLTISFNGGMSSIGYRTISFLYIGAFIGIITNMHKQIKVQNQH